MTTTAYSAFLLVALIGIITPGLDTMLILRHSLLGGRRAGVATFLGINLGCVIWGTASVAGLTALLTASQIAYDVVRVAGAAYLLWLGGTALWKSLPRNRVRHPDEVRAAPVRLTGWAALRAGMTTNLLNPKVGVFYVSLLPQFLPAGQAALAWGPLLVATHVSIGLLWSTGLVWVAGRARALFERQRVRDWLDRITATVLIGLGLKLAVEGRRTCLRCGGPVRRGSQGDGVEAASPTAALPASPDRVPGKLLFRVAGGGVAGVGQAS